jgi:hypothetical protein
MSVDPRIPDEIAAARKSAGPGQEETHALQQELWLFDYLVSAGEQRRRDGYAQCFRRLEV